MYFVRRNVPAPKTVEALQARAVSQQLRETLFQATVRVGKLSFEHAARYSSSFARLSLCCGSPPCFGMSRSAAGPDVMY